MTEARTAAIAERSARPPSRASLTLPRKRAVTANEKLRALYRTGHESGTKKPDDGSTFIGLLSLEELRKLRDNDV